MIYDFEWSEWWSLQQTNENIRFRKAIQILKTSGYIGTVCCLFCFGQNETWIGKEVTEYNFAYLWSVLPIMLTHQSLLPLLLKHPKSQFLKAISEAWINLLCYMWNGFYEGVHIPLLFHALAKSNPKSGSKRKTDCGV